MNKIFLSILIVVFVSGCDIEPPQTINVCLESETRIVAVPKAAAPGMPGSGGISFVTRSECVKSETRRNPEHDRWLQRQEEKDG